MESIKNAFAAPFSETAAAATTPMKTAIAYSAVGFVLGVFLKGN